MTKRIILDKNELIQKYTVEGLSQKKCAEYFGCSVDVVVSNLKYYGIPSHAQGSWCVSTTEIPMTDEMKQILDGAMLGDGSLYKHKHSVNAQFCYASKSYQHVDFVVNKFIDYANSERIKHISIFDKRTKKTYERYSFRSVVSPTFKKEYDRWYKKGVKHIPNDLVLTPLVCLIWYIGDGSLLGNSKNASQEIKISTNCFNKEELERIVIPQLKEFNPYLSFAGISSNGKEQYVIKIRPKEKAIKFLDYIGKCPFQDYQYKWNIKERKVPSYIDDHKKWIELYQSGIGYTKIAEEYGCDKSTVWYVLEKAGVRRPFCGYKKYYKQWEDKYLSGMSYSDIAKEYGCNSHTVRYHIINQIKKGVIHDAKS